MKISQLTSKLRILSVNRFTHKNLNLNKVVVGEFTYGTPIIHNITGKYKTYIGNFCSISNNVHIIVDGNHRTDWISTYPFGELIEDLPKNEGHPTGNDVKIGNDVWIGKNVIILPGVHIGDGAVIGAGSIVTKDIASYEIVDGNPARHIRYRFTNEQIKLLEKIKWWNWPLEKIKANVNLLQSANIDEFLKKFK